MSDRRRDRLVIIETKIDTSKYVRGTAPSPFLLDQLYREAKREVKGSNYGASEDLVARQAFLRKVSVVFHRRCRELGIPMEGA